MSNIYGRQLILPLVNKSGGALVAGDVVIVDTTNNEAVTTTTTGRFEGAVGVAQEAIASNATGRVLVGGYAALVNVPSSVTRGHYVETHTVAKQAAGSSTRRSGSFGVFLTGGTTPTALIGGLPDQTASGGGATVATVDAALGADVTMTTASTFYDGCSASFASGLWLILAKSIFEIVGTQTLQFTAKLWDGSTVYDESQSDMVTTSGAGFAVEVVNIATVTLVGTTTLKVSGAAIRNSQKMLRDVNVNGSALHKASRLIGYKVS